MLIMVVRTARQTTGCRRAHTHARTHTHNTDTHTHTHTLQAVFVNSVPSHKNIKQNQLTISRQWTYQQAFTPVSRGLFTAHQLHWIHLNWPTSRPSYATLSLVTHVTQSALDWLQWKKDAECSVSSEHMYSQSGCSDQSSRIGVEFSSCAVNKL